MTPRQILRRPWKNKPYMPLQNNLLENKSRIQRAISDNIIIHNLQSSTHLFPSCNQISILFIYLETTTAVSFNPGSMWLLYFTLALEKETLRQKRLPQPTWAQNCMAYVQDRSAQPNLAIPAEAIIAHSRHRMFYCFELCTAHLSHRIAAPLLTPSSKKLVMLTNINVSLITIWSVAKKKERKVTQVPIQLKDMPCDVWAFEI